MVEYLNAEMSVEDFLVKLKMIMPEDCKPHETVIFLDEIQKCPEIVTKIKFLVDEGSFKYAMSGSLLVVELKGIRYSRASPIYKTTSVTAALHQSTNLPLLTIYYFPYIISRF